MLSPKQNHRFLASPLRPSLEGTLRRDSLQSQCDRHDARSRMWVLPEAPMALMCPVCCAACRDGDSIAPIAVLPFEPTSN